jgi:hypothetical protein
MLGWCRERKKQKRAYRRKRDPVPAFVKNSLLRRAMISVDFPKTPVYPFPFFPSTSLHHAGKNTFAHQAQLDDDDDDCASQPFISVFCGQS